MVTSVIYSVRSALGGILTNKPGSMTLIEPWHPILEWPLPFGLDTLGWGIATCGQEPAPQSLPLQLFRSIRGNPESENY